MERPSTLPNLCFYHYPVKGEHVIDDILAESLTLTVTTDVRGYTSYTNQDGKLHRIHGPAVIHASGTCSWWMNGQRHRPDGPAMEWSDGSKSWYMNGHEQSDDALAELLTLTMEVDEYGDTRYRNHLGQFHRIHGPAVIWAGGGKGWFLDGKRHRTDGPAIEWSDGDNLWYLNDEHITEEMFNGRIKTH